MICPDCTKAGQIKREADKETDRDDISRALYRTATRMHKRCKGGTWCDCQHSITRHALTTGKAILSYG